MMELLLQHLDQVRVPKPKDKVYKDECLFSFDSPETATGLYVSLTTFYGFGRDYVEIYHKKFLHRVFLHIRRERHEGDGPEKKITRLAIGVEGGFDPESGRKKFELIDSYSIVLLPQFDTIPYPNPNLPDAVQNCVRAILEAQSASKLAELEALTGTWDGEQRMVSQYAENLQQVQNGKKISPVGWQCEKCDKRENLWLNLTDGSVMCGRKFHDGSGGNNHAVQHFNRTGFPLVVKLGTITKEGKADVFSYLEDDMVEDPLLDKHLAHWGINISAMEKTEKSMVELELDLNQRVGEWATMQESGAQLRPVYGPGYTGMVNLGNSCYLNSVMQLLFRVPDFVRRFVDGSRAIFESFPPDPANDFNVQMAKLGVGLLSGRYSAPPDKADAEPAGVCPLMFKALIGRGHKEFSTKRQQDAQEFLSHVLTLLERSAAGRPDPAACFRFQLEERVQCTATKKVKYTHRADWLLPLSIPLEAAVNKDEVLAAEARRAEAPGRGPAGVRPRLRLSSCLEAFTQTDLIEQFYSTALGEKTTARKTTRLATLPDYLVIQLKKFTLSEDWVPIKLDVAVDMPDELDLAALRGAGPQPGEEFLPELEGPPPPLPPMNPEVLAGLEEMGFPPEACRRAVYFTNDSGFDAALAWVMDHIGDPDFADFFVPPGTEPTSFTPDAGALKSIMDMGFSKEHAVKALKATGNDLQRGIDWIFSHRQELSSADAPAEPEFRDGDSKYRLVAFISHMGQSVMVGHYVCHILREGRWVIYNDAKVALSENPPKDLGYVYLYERL